MKTKIPALFQNIWAKVECFMKGKHMFSFTRKLMGHIKET